MRARLFVMWFFMRSTGCAVQLLLNLCFAKLIYHYLQFSLNNFERSSLCLNATITFVIITDHFEDHKFISVCALSRAILNK